MDQNLVGHGDDIRLKESFLILQIKKTKDEDQIQGAYRKLLVKVNPEDDPEGFKRLRGAYETALGYARTPDDGEGAILEAEWMEPDSLSARFFKKFTEIYADISLRINLHAWEELLQDPVLDSLDEGEMVKWGLFSRLSKNFRLPCRVWGLLDRTFFVRESRQEFEEHLPKDFVDYMIFKIEDESGQSDIPYEQLRGEAGADFDGFIHDYIEYINRGWGDGEEELRRRREQLGRLDLYGIGHPWLELEKAKLWQSEGRTAEALQKFCELQESCPHDVKIQLNSADAFYDMGRLQEAEEIYQRYLDAHSSREQGRFTALCGLARVEAGRGNWKEARRLALDARELNNTRELTDLLKEIFPKVVDTYLESPEALEQEDVRILGWSFVQSDRSAEGLEFFRSHPQYCQDAAWWHRLSATMHLLTGQGQEALEEARLWRGCLQEEGGQDEIPDSYEIEGRAYRELYVQAKKEAGANGGEEGGAREQEFFRQALASFDRAVELNPRAVDYQMERMLLLREARDYNKVVDACEKILELDKDFYWACYYLQEAYEGLHMAQEVIDTFYRAKRIYGGRPEIYERAVKVFIAYSQYADAQNILNQAEGAGAQSYELMLAKIEVMDNLAEDYESWKKADDWAADVIARMEEEKAPAGWLAKAYFKRACLNEDTKRSKNAKTLKLSCKYAKESQRLQDNVSALYFLGRYYECHKKNSKQAYGYFKMCEERGMTYVYMYYYLARCMEHFKKWDDAVEYYKKAAEKDPDNKDFYWRIAWLYRQKFNRTGQPEYGQLALRYLELQEEKAGESAMNFRQRAYVHYRMKENMTALEEINRGVEMDPDSWMWEIRGQILSSLHRYEEAIDSYTNSIRAEDRYNEDNKFCVEKIFQAFLRKKDLGGGIAYLKKLEKELKDIDEKRACWDYIAKLEAERGNYGRAMRWLQKEYGSVDVGRRVCIELEREADRISAVFDIWQRYMPMEEAEKIIGKKGRAAARMVRREAQDETEPATARASLLENMGEVFFNMADFETALEFYERAYELTRRMKNYSNAKNLAHDLMTSYFWNGDMKNARKFGRIYRRYLEKPFKECGDLGLSMEELMTRPTKKNRSLLYNLFLYAYCTGQEELADAYLENMEAGRMCYWCDEDGCTEMWELFGLKAMLAGEYKKARMCLQQANAFCYRGDNKDARMMLILIDREEKRAWACTE